MVLANSGQPKLPGRLVAVLLLAALGFSQVPDASAKGFGYSKTRFSRIKIAPIKFRFRIGKGFPPAPPATPPPPAAITVNVKNYGAKGDGKADDWSAINAAIAACGTNGTVYFPTGKYAVSTSLTLNSQSATGDGVGSQILNTNNQNFPALVVNGGGTVSNIAIQGNAASANGLVIQNVTTGNFAVQQTTLLGPFANAVVLNNASNGVVSNCKISNYISSSSTPVIGLRLTDHCNNVQIDGNTFDQVSTYAIAGFPVATRSCSVNLTISNNHLFATDTEAITLSGVSNCRILNNVLDFRSWQGAQFIGIKIFGVDQAYFGPSSDIQITGNQLLRCGSTDAGAIVLGGWATAGQPGMTNVLVSNNVVTQGVIVSGTSLSRGIFTRGSAGGISNLVITGNTLTGTGVCGMWIADSVNTSIANNTINDGTGEGIFMLPTNGGALSIANNVMANDGSGSLLLINNGYIRARGAIDVDKDATTTYTSVAITNNVYNPPPNNLSNFIYCAVSRSIASVTGNQTTTLLPNFLAP